MYKAVLNHGILDPAALSALRLGLAKLLRLTLNSVALARLEFVIYLPY